MSGQTHANHTYRVVNGQKNMADKRISELMKQSKQLSEQIESVNQNKDMDDKIRMERVHALKEQIQQIEAQISQIRTEALSKQQKKDEEKNSKQSAPKEKSDMDVVIKISVNFEQVKVMEKTKGQMERDSGTLNNNIRSDRHLLEISPTGDSASKAAMKQNLEGTVVKGKQEKINKIENSLDTLNDRIANAYEEIGNTVEQAREDEEKAEETGASDEADHEVKQNEGASDKSAVEETLAEAEKKEENEARGRSARTIDIRV